MQFMQANHGLLFAIHFELYSHIEEEVEYYKNGSGN